MDTDTREALAALPPLPEPVQYEHREPRERYTAEQMRTYALAALAIPSAPAQPSAHRSGAGRRKWRGRQADNARLSGPQRPEQKDEDGRE
jgi:hypothetical protein